MSTDQHTPSNTGSHAESHAELNVSSDALLPDPGLHEHTWRPTDVDPRAERRAERQVAAFFGLSAVATVLFVVSYFAIKAGFDGDTFIGLGARTSPSASPSVSHSCSSGSASSSGPASSWRTSS